MTDVPVGLTRDESHVYSANYPGEPVRQLVSITTALKALDKPAIPIWARRQTAEAAVNNLPMLNTMIETAGKEATADYLVKVADHTRDTKADTGTDVHAMIEAYYLTLREATPVVDDSAAAFWRAFLEFDRVWHPEVIAVEYMVCSLTYGYAGTGDLVVLMWCPVDNRYCRFRLDTKTMGISERGANKGKRKGPYRETALQLAAAHYAEFTGIGGDPKKYTVPRADHCGVLALVEDGSYAVVPYTVTPQTFKGFLAALDAWNWLQSEAKTAIGQPLEAAREKAAA